MATEIKLPRLGQGMESGTIVKWLKSEGEPVEKGEPLYELDTDKVTQEVEADASGVLLKIAVAGGRGRGRQDDRGDRRAGRRGLDLRQWRARHPDGPTEAPAPAVSPVQDSGTCPSRNDGDRIKASPLARRIARRERGLDLAQLRGTGPDGHRRRGRGTVGTAVSADVRGLLGQVEVRQLSKVRQTIARRLTRRGRRPSSSSSSRPT